jgi:hypothetical protein
MAIAKRSTSMQKSSSTAMKYRPNEYSACRSLAKGTKPLAEAASVQHVLIMMIIHLCRKIMYGLDTSHKVGMYIVGTLILSVIGDFGPGEGGSNSYMAKADNVFNAYFVKLGWGWTISFVTLFVALTSYTTSCGNRNVMKKQAIRLCIATAVWYFMTMLFEVIEARSGICNVTKYLTKSSCIKKGFNWKGFDISGKLYFSLKITKINLLYDISGHCFLLIWNNLFILEEAKAYLGWEKIKDMLLNEEHKRLDVSLKSSGDSSAVDKTILSKLKSKEFLHLRTNYKANTPWVRLLFCILAMWFTLWDLMLICTALYFHITIEKVVASCLAVLIWFSLYRVFYTLSWSPGNNL